MSAPSTSDPPPHRGLIARITRAFGALPAGVAAGVVSGAVFGGVAGRILMRLIALIDKSTDGAETDFGTVGEITIGGTVTLTILTTLAGLAGGVIYVIVRRWIPWSSPARGAFFGLLMMFGPGVIFLGEVDLQIFEPALPIFAMFIGLVVIYGVSVALITDRLHPARAVRPGPRMERAARWLVVLAVAGIVFMVAASTYNVSDKAGICLTADKNGGCGVRASHR